MVTAQPEDRQPFPLIQAVRGVGAAVSQFGVVVGELRQPLTRQIRTSIDTWAMTSISRSMRWSAVTRWRREELAASFRQSCKDSCSVMLKRPVSI